VWTPKRTRVETFRFDASTIERLERAAKRAKTTKSGLLKNILMDRLIIDPLLPAFQEIGFEADTFRSILASANTDALEGVASDVAHAKIPLVRELYENNSRRFDFRVLVEEILGRHWHWFDIEEGAHHQLMLRHRYGLRWSKFMASYLSGAQVAFSNEPPSIAIGDQFVRIELKTQGTVRDINAESYGLPG
jgi:hypothetical protein